ncbi:MAG: type IV secretory system conjugative DNA transfer family protein [Gemmataceae bacterium]
MSWCVSFLARALLGLALLAPWGVLVVAGVAALAWFPWAIVLLIGVLLWGAWRSRLIPRANFDGVAGTGRLANLFDVARRGGLGGRGVPVGTLPPPTFREVRAAVWHLSHRMNREACRAFWAWLRRSRVGVRIPDAVNTVVFAPTGVGKTAGYATPLLLLDTATSAVVIDVDGAIYRATAEHRKRRGHRIVLLDPLGIVTGARADTCNPLELVDWQDPFLLDRARMIAVSVVVVTGEEKDPHWPQSAVVWITAAIAFLAGAAADCNDRSGLTLTNVYALIADDAVMTDAMRVMAACPVHRGTVASLARQVLSSTGEEKASIRSTALTHLAGFNTAAVIDATTGQSFDPIELRRRKSTVYIVLPPYAIDEKKSLVRAWLTCMMRRCVDAGPTHAGAVTFVLDEAASLKRVEEVEKGVTEYRKYGLRFLFFFQAADQLRESFSEAGRNKLLANATQVYQGVQDYQTAELVSKMLGPTTLTLIKPSTSGGWSSSHQAGGPASGSSSESFSVNVEHVQRDVLQPAEVLRLPSRVALVFTPDCPPALTYPVRHYERGFWRAYAAGPGAFGLLVRSAVAFAATVGLVGATVAMVVPAAAYELNRQQHLPGGALHPTLQAAGLGREQQAGEIVRDGLGQVVFWQGRPVVCPRGHHVEINPADLSAWVVRNGERQFPPRR